MKQEVYYLDEKNNLTDEEKAIKAMIREVDENGKLIKESIAMKKEYIEKYMVNNSSKITEEQRKILDEIVDKNGNHIFSKEKV